MVFTPLTSPTALSIHKVRGVLWMEANNTSLQSAALGKQEQKLSKSETFYIPRGTLNNRAGVENKYNVFFGLA